MYHQMRFAASNVDLSVNLTHHDHFPHIALLLSSFHVFFHLLHIFLVLLSLAFFFFLLSTLNQLSQNFAYLLNRVSIIIYKNFSNNIRQRCLLAHCERKFSLLRMLSMHFFDDTELKCLDQRISLEFPLRFIMVVVIDNPIHLLIKWRFRHSKKVLCLKNAHEGSFRLFLDDQIACLWL